MSIKATGYDPSTGQMKKIGDGVSLEIDGNIVIGDGDTDDITVGGEFKSHLIPDANDTYDLGENGKGWRHIYSSGVAKLTAIKIQTRDLVGTGWTQALTSDDCALFCAGSGSRTITLPTTTGKSGRILFIKDVTGNSAANNITIAALDDPQQQIDGGNTYVISENGTSVIFICDGVSWVLVGKI